MRDGWKRVKLGEVCSIRRGASPRPIQNFIQDSCKGGMPWVKIADATSSDSRYIFSTHESIIEEGVSHSVVVEPETFILSNSATPGLPKIMKITACVHDGWLVLSEFRGIERDFLYYKCLDIRRVLSNQANGSVFQNLKSDIVRDFDVDLPPPPTQRAIAAVLGALDDKIELNRKMNANLEAQAQALFKSWFVDFEPWGGKMPSGWKKGTVADVADVVGGGTPSKSRDDYFTEKGIAWLTPKDLSITHAKFTARGTTDISDEGLRNSGARLMPKGSVLFSSRAPIGYLTIAQNEICTNQGFKSLVPMQLGTAYLYYYLQNATPRIQSIASGSTFKEASGSLMKSLEILIPSKKESLDFEETIKPIFQEQELLECQSRKLAELRDALLPKLMSGELEVA